MRAEHLVLSLEQSLNGTHQRTALARQVRSGLLVEGGREQVARTNADAESYTLLIGLARSILIDCVRAVEATALKEHGAQ